ncbi:MAG TPA: ABC transporter substrate-binding protein [Candidatus Binatia bacterium]|jgi:NitT/TauT family transport system substrate-binding protein
MGLARQVTDWCIGTLGLAGLSLLLSILAAVPSMAEPVRISVTNQNISFLPAAVALKRGFFRDEGLDLEIIRMNTPNTITALATGDIGYTLLFGSVVRAAIRGMPMRVTASLLDSPTHALVARSELESVKDLRGKTIGIGNFGGTDEVVARMLCKHFGLDPERDLKMIALGPDRARLAALKENLVAAAIVAPPVDRSARQMGFTILVRGYDVFSFPFIGVGTTTKRIKEKPLEVKGAIKALIRANRFIRQEKEAAVKILMEWGRAEREHASSSYDSTLKVFSANGNIPEEGLRLVVDLARAELKVNREVSAAEVAETAPLREAQKELRIN